MLVDLFVAMMQVTVSVAITQLEISAANMWVTIFFEIMHVGVAITQVVFSAVQKIVIVIMQVTVSVIAMYVSVSSRNFIVLFLTDTHFS